MDDRQVGVLEGCVGETEAEFEARLDVLLVKGAVVEVRALSKVTLRIRVVRGSTLTWFQNVAVVALVAGKGIRKLTGELSLTVEKLHESSPRILAREMGDDGGCDVGMLDPLVHKANPGRMDDNYRVCALASNIENEAVAKVVVKAFTIPPFSGNGVDEHDTYVRGCVHVWVVRLEIPIDPGIGFLCLVLNSTQWLREVSHDSLK